MRKILFLIILVINSFHTKGQIQKKYKPINEFVIASVSHTCYSNSYLKKDNYSGEFENFETSFNLSIPIVLKKKKIVILNSFGYTNLKMGAFNDTSSNYKNLHTYSHRLGVTKILRNNWTITGSLQYAFASDFKANTSTSDVFYNISTLAIKRKNKYFQYGFGLAYTANFGKKMIIPLFIMNYKKGKSSTNLVFPYLISLFRHFDKSKLGFKAEINSNIFNLESNYPGIDLDKMNYLKINVGPTFEFNLYKFVKLSISGGISLVNKMDFNNQNDKKELSLSPKENLFFKVALKLAK